MITEGKTVIDLTDDERVRIKDTSKVIAGTAAAFAGYDVNRAANSANIAVENNSLAKLATTAGKAAYKVAKKISEMPATLRAKGVDLKAAKNVDALKFDKKIIQKILINHQGSKKTM